MRLYSSRSVWVTLAAICICFGVVISLLGLGITKPLQHDMHFIKLFLTVFD